jgi:hypothetical protein
MVEVRNKICQVNFALYLWPAATPHHTIKALGQTVNNNVKQISRTLGGCCEQLVFKKMGIY